MSTVPDDAPVTRGFLQAVLAPLAKSIKAMIAPLSARVASCETKVGALAMIGFRGTDAARVDEVETLLAQVADMRVRLKALEARPQLEYRGVWKDGVGFERGSLVTHGGGMWHCNAATLARPGTDSSWTLCVKAPR